MYSSICQLMSKERRNIKIESLAPKNYNLKVGQTSEYFYKFYNLDKKSLLKKVLQQTNAKKISYLKNTSQSKFFGGGTDIKKFLFKTKGKVISTTIDKYVYVTVKEHGELFRRNFRLNYSKSENKNKLSKIENNIIRETLREIKIKRPIYISSISDVPYRTGLGSSSSFAVGLINALLAFEVGILPKKNCRISM